MVIKKRTGGNKQEIKEEENKGGYENGKMKQKTKKLNDKKFEK